MTRIERVTLRRTETRIKEKRSKEEMKIRKGRERR